MSENPQLQEHKKQKELQLYDFELSEFSKIVFSLTEFRGSWYINIRTLARVHPAQKNWARTQKGVFVPISKIKEMLQGLDQIAKKLKKGLE